jgi:hypothetical protein
MSALYVIIRPFRCISAHTRLLHILKSKEEEAEGGKKKKTPTHTNPLLFRHPRADKLGSSSYGSTTMTTLHPKRRAYSLDSSLPSLLLLIAKGKERKGTSGPLTLSFSLFCCCFLFSGLVASFELRFGVGQRGWGQKEQVELSFLFRMPFELCF